VVFDGLVYFSDKKALGGALFLFAEMSNPFTRQGLKK
jgi:hypothetical protein